MSACEKVAASDDCFQRGECTDSFHLSSDFSSDEYSCLDSCNSEQLCNWFTFASAINFCKLLHNCSTVDVDKCPDCLTGQAGCLTQDPKCFVNGECRGNMLFFTVAENKEECLRVCKETFGCKWFTFHGFKSPESTCILYYDCQDFDESCDTCVSGERRCDEETSTTASTTTTTAATTSTTTSSTKGN